MTVLILPLTICVLQSNARKAVWVEKDTDDENLEVASAAPYLIEMRISMLFRPAEVDIHSFSFNTVFDIIFFR